jgi:N-carbamoyl-L-amino-acid hydrolase
LRVASAAAELGGADTVATTGVLDVFPRAINSIPSKTYLEIDIRDTLLARRDAVLDHVFTAAKEIGGRHQQETTVELISKDPPAVCGEHIVVAIEAACATVGATHQRMISRAYHDCLFMALLCPTAMIFIPCRDGISHRPDEYASPEQIEIGVQVLAHTLADLAK